ncbi:MAG: ribokinase [Pseudomonadota bacterium]|nr:ribokinase [Pseudomonadota bacterium]
MITVFGSLNVDYIFQVSQLPAPGETVLASNMQVLPGGKGANQAVAAARAGAKVSMVGAVGRDALSKIALAGLLDAGVDTSAVALSTMPTGTAAINVDAQGENAITVSSGANLDARGDSLDEKNLTPRTTVLLQMEVPMTAMADLVQRARKKESCIVWNLAPMQCVDLALLKQVNCLIVNEVELNQLHSEFHQTLGPNNGSAKDVEQKAWDIFTLTRQSVVVTLGAKGTLAVHDNTLLTVPALAISPVDTVGAGDAFTGAFTAALDRGETFPVALRWGSVAGGLACLETGAQSSLPTAAQISEHLAALPGA